MIRKSHRLAAAFAVSALLLTACSSGGDSGSSSLQTPVPSASPTAATAGERQLTMFMPDDGTAPVVDFINSAKKTMDIAMFEFDSTFTELTEPLKAAKERGVEVRILLSRTRLNGPGGAENSEDVEAFRKMGFQAELASADFAWFHEKAFIADGKEADGRALIADFNLGSDYFSTAVSAYDPDEAGTRGMGVIDTDPKDVANIMTTFDEDWPPYSAWSGSNRPDLVWAPAGNGYPTPGNAVTALTDLINSATTSIDAYVQLFASPSLMLQPLLDAANRGVKVRFVTNEKAIAEPVLGQLQGAGIEIVMAPQSLADPSKYMYIHSKTIIVDQGKPNAVAFVGSENPFLDDSLLIERELGTLVRDPGSIENALAVFNRDFAASKAYSAS